MSDLYMPDTPEGRAIEQVVASLADGQTPGQLATAKRLARIGGEAIAKLVGADEAAGFLISLSRDVLKARGCGKGAKRG
jgi:hypothetical protein